MPRQIYVFDEPDRFLAGAIGEPGQRQFYLQVRKGAILVTVALEKAQVAVLAERIAALVGEIRRQGLEGPARRSPTAAEAGGLSTPVRELFRVGTMTLSWDGDERRLTVEARAQLPDDSDELEVPDDDEDGPDLIRVRMDSTAAERFAEAALGVVASGRPPCPLCQMPLNPEGHICPRRNGHLVH